MEKIIILGTAHPYRGGLASFNERLCEAFNNKGKQAEIYTFSLQYPSLLFPGKTQLSESKKPELNIDICVNSINPINWRKVGNKIRKSKPDVLIFKYWTPFMAPCFGTIARIVKKNKYTKIITIVDNMIPHERHFYDSILSKYFVKPVDAYIAMSQSVYDDINKFDAGKPKKLSPHPLFDNFGEKITKQDAINNIGLDSNYIYFLFFGIIRSYKGLDLLIDAFADERLRKYPVKLLIAGEFYEDSKPYTDAIKKYKLEDNIVLHDKFIENSDVKNYFCASDLVVQPYKSATQSGVTQIGYHFEKPMLVTDVGGLAEIIPNGEVGYVTKPDSKDIADSLVSFLENKTDFSEGIHQEKKKYSWDEFVLSIENLYKSI